MDFLQPVRAFAARSKKRSLSGPLDVWQATRDEIWNDVFTNFWSDELKSLVLAKGTNDLDAARC
jgi:hypothetical protein